MWIMTVASLCLLPNEDHTSPFFVSFVDVVPAPKNLRFSEVTQTSFRATWEHGAPDVALYRIGWAKKGDAFQYVRKKTPVQLFTFPIIHAGIT